MSLTRYLQQLTKCTKNKLLLSTVNVKSLEYSSRYNSSLRKYTDRHEWVIVDKGIGTVGISKYAQESLGDVVFAQLPESGTTFNAGDECGALESVKAASEIYSPLSGTVTESNKDVEDKPGLINSNYYDKGWLFKLKLLKPEELNNLMNEDQYNEFLKADVETVDK